ncbi:MAG: MerR family transcriptional regulator [Terriglobia bacterium]
MSQNHRLRKKGSRALSEASIPEKVYFRIGEVSRLAQTKPYVLRYWETEFPSLRPSKTQTGHRLYRRKDVETVFRIKRLLYEQGFTIEGARKQIAAVPKAAGRQAAQSSLFNANPDGAGLRLIQQEMRNILTMLSRKC